MYIFIVQDRIDWSRNIVKHKNILLEQKLVGELK